MTRGRIRLILFGLVVALCLAACGASDDGGERERDDDTDEDGDVDGDQDFDWWLPDGDAPDGDSPDGDAPDGDAPDGDAPDGDAPDGDAPDGDAPDGDAPDGDETSFRYTGSVTLSEMEMISPGPTVTRIASAGAYFSRTAATSGAGIVVDHCLVFPYPSDEPVETSLGLNAGVISISGAAISPITLTPYQSAGYGWLYSDDMGDGVTELFSTDDTLQAVVSGGDEISSLNGIIPVCTPFAGLAPDLRDPDLDASIPTSLSWTPAEGRITATISGFELLEGSIMTGATVMCTEDSDDGSITFPSAALSYLPDSFYSLTLTVSRTHSERKTAGDSEVYFGATCTLSRSYN